MYPKYIMYSTILHWNSKENYTFHRAYIPHKFKKTIHIPDELAADAAAWAELAW